MTLVRIVLTSALAALIAWIALSAEQPLTMAVGIAAPAWIALEAAWRLFDELP